MLNDYQQQQLIIVLVGDPNSTLTPTVALLWEAFADKALVHPALRALYTRRGAINARLAEEVLSTTITVGQDLTDQQDQRTTHLQAMYAETSAEIVRIESIARSSRGARTGALTAVQPILPPTTDGPNAADPIYRGDVYDTTDRDLW